MVSFIKKHKFSLLAGVIVIAIMMVLAQNTYPALILAYIMIYGIATTGLDILFGYSGQISFGHAGLFAIGSYTSALLSTKLGVTPILSILAGCVLATVIGVLIAIPASKLVKHFLSLLTIAFGQVIYLFVNSYAKLTGGSGGIKNIPYIRLFGFTFDSYFSCFVGSMVLLAVVLIVKHNIVNSRTGSAFVAIRENVHAAEGLGINVRKYKVMAFGISAFMVGLAGGLYAHLNAYISPESYNATQSTLFMTMLLFGGIATPLGPVVGAAILMYIKEVLQFLQVYQVLIYGVFILVALFFFPNGVVGVADNIRRWFKSFAEKRRGKNAAA